MSFDGFSTTKRRAANSLACVVFGLIGEYTVVDLRNDSYVSGQVIEVDGCMNISMSDVVFHDSMGNRVAHDLFFIRERQVRHVHIPSRLNINETIKRGLKKLLSTRRIQDPQKRTFRQSRLERQQQETLKLIAQKKKEEEKKEDV